MKAKEAAKPGLVCVIKEAISHEMLDTLINEEFLDIYHDNDDFKIISCNYQIHPLSGNYSCLMILELP